MVQFLFPSKTPALSQDYYKVGGVSVGILILLNQGPTWVHSRPVYTVHLLNEGGTPSTEKLPDFMIACIFFLVEG